MTGTLTADMRKLGEGTRFGNLPATITFSIREPGSALTHFAALIAMLVGAGPLLTRASIYGNTVTLATLWVFVICACILYAASTTYHTIVLDRKKTTIFRKFDHMSISIMIAGTYTPCCLVVLGGRQGLILLIAIWTMALIGVAVKAVWITCPKFFSSALYVAMGWLCIFAIRPLAEALPLHAFLLLLFGGIFYTVGAVIYAMHPKKFDARHIYFGSHEIFHCFIMAGTLCHYLLMYRYVAFLAGSLF